MKNIAVLITCHNRRTTTLRCLDHLFQCELPPEWSLDVFLVDDGSTDGTSEAVRRSHPAVHIERGGGNLYWNGGMRLAFSRAIEEGFDAYVWLNDDTLLFPDAIQRLIHTLDRVSGQRDSKAIIVGTTRDVATEQATYGGVRALNRLLPFKYVLVQPKEEPAPCDAMNGNLVLIPSAVVAEVGNLDSRFVHAMGDTDYGLRARKFGCSIFVAPGFCGTCSKNASEGTFTDLSLSKRERLRKMLAAKGLPIVPWLTLTRRHGGLLWPLFFLWPYVRVILSRRTCTTD